MSNRLDTATLLADLVSRALTGRTKLSGLPVELVDTAAKGVCLLVSGEGQRSDIEDLARKLSCHFGEAVTVGTDTHPDYVGGEFTCMWLNIETAVANLETP